MPAPVPTSAPTAAPEWRSRDRVNPADDGKENRANADKVRPVDHEPTVEGEDFALALPRLILAPPRVVLNVAYLPLRGLLHLMGRYKIPDRVIDFLYNDDRTAAILPTFSFLGGQGVTVGVSMFHGGFGRHEERIAFAAKFGGRYVQSYSLELTAPSVAGTPLEVEVATRFEVEPDLRFFGYGPSPETDAVPSTLVGPRDAHVETRYRQQRGMVRARVGWRFTNSIDLGLIGTLNRRDFGENETEDATEPSIDRVYDTAEIPGFDRGYTLVEPLVDFTADTRFPKGVTASGVYFNAFGGGAPPQNGYAFAHYGAELAGFIDLFMGDRILALHAAHESVVGDDAEIPFADLPRLGGPRRLRGYDLHRFRDKHTALATIEYHWPIHEYVSGVAFFEVGSVGKDYEEMVDPESYKLSGGGGLMFRSRHTKLFSLQVAYGDAVQFFLTSDPLVAFSKRGGEEL